MDASRFLAAQKGVVIAFAGICVAALSSLPSWAQEYDQLKGQRYDTVRGEFVDNYWNPSPPGCTDLGGTLCAVYPELEGCAGTGLAPCVFWWTSESGDVTLKIFTSGEIKRTITSVEKVKKIIRLGENSHTYHQLALSRLFM